MARWGIWAASAIGAAGAGAGVALLRRRRPVADGGMADLDQAVPVDAGGLDPVPAEAAPAEDPQEALDAARERLRSRAEALRDQIEREGEEPPPGG